MSTLTTSAVGGRKTAPKPQYQRRAARSAGEHNATESRRNSLPVTHPSAAQVQQSSDQEAVNLITGTDEQRRGPPSPPIVVERPVTSLKTGTGSFSTRTTANTRALRSSGHGLNELSDAVSGNDSNVIASAAYTGSRGTDQSQPTRKRARDTVHPEGVPVPKRTRTATRSTSSLAENSTHSRSDSGANPASQQIENRVIRSPGGNNTSRTRTRTRAAAHEANTHVNTITSSRRSTRVLAHDSLVDPAIINGNDAELHLDQIADTLTPQLQEDTSQPAQPRQRKQTRSKAARSARRETAEDSEAGPDGREENSKIEEIVDEERQIDPKTLSMFELSHDSKIGKTSEREKRMAQIDWAEVARKRREEADAIMKGELQPELEGQNVLLSTEGNSGSVRGGHDGSNAQPNIDDQGRLAARPEPITRPSGGGVRFRIVGGQLVEDEASLTIDRAARVVQAAETAGQAVEEENDLTVRLNRTTYINARRRDPMDRVPLWRSKSDAWTEEDTDRFYDALRMFGTDFFIISKMFPPRTRKQIKLKFVREERLEPDRVNAALLGRRTGGVDLDHYAQAINRDVADFHKYDGLEHANEVIRASMKDKEEAMRAAVKEDEENNRQREAQRLQREKQRLEAEKKKEERAKKKAMSRRGDVWGAGTLGGADDDVDDFQND